MKTHDILTLAVLAVLPLSALFCAGTSETGNAAMLTGAIVRNAQPVGCAMVRLVADGFIPGTKTKGKVFSTTTDTDGRYAFTHIPPGDYYLNAEKDDGRVLRGPFTLEESEENPTEPMVTDTLKKVATITLSIPEDKEVSVVYIEGLVDSWEAVSGTVTIDNIPAGTVVITGLTATGGASVPQTATTIEVTPADTIVTVIGNRPPVIVSTESELSAKITELPASYSTAINAYDPESGELTFTLLDGPEGLQLNETTGKISWQLSSDIEETVHKVGVRVSDPDGGTRSVWWNISFFWSTPDENLPPVITLLGGNTVEVHNGDTDHLDYYLTAISVVDPEGDEITIHDPVHQVNVFKDSVYVVEYSATDEFGNTGTASRNITIKTTDEPDTLPPILTIIDTMITIMKGNEFTPPQYSAFDLEDGQITDKVIIEGTVNTEVVGIYDIEYSVTDAAGNKTIKTVRVRVIDDFYDTIPPVIILLGANPCYVSNLTSLSAEEVLEEYVEPGAIAFDYFNMDITDSIKSSPPELHEDGQWYISYYVDDRAGNTGQIYRELTSSATAVPPVIELQYLDSTIEVPVSGPWIEPGYTALDGMDGDITDQVVVDSSYFDVERVGTYSVIYMVTNSRNIQTTVVRTVRVLPVVINNPVITLLGKNPDTVLLRSSEEYMDPGATAIHEIEGDITDRMTITGNVNMNSLGRYSLTYRVQDNTIGWFSIETRTVYVVRDTMTTDLLLKYSAPATEPIPTMIKTYHSVEVDGNGPDISGIDSLLINWNLEDEELRMLAVYFNGESIVTTLSADCFLQAQQPALDPNFDIETIPEFNGGFWVVIDGDMMYWIDQQTEEFVIIWSEE